MIWLLLACGSKEPTVEAQAAAPKPAELGVKVEAPKPPPAPIEVLAPAADTVLVPGGELQVEGKASVWEGALTVQLLASDELIFEQHVTASTSAPGRGSFSLAIPVPEGQSGGPWTLKLFSSSPRDGSPENLVVVPLEGP